MKQKQFIVVELSMDKVKLTIGIIRRVMSMRTKRVMRKIIGTR